MLEEDVTVATVESVLLDLATDKATGCLSVARLDGEVVDLFIKSGQLYAVTVPGRRARIGARLISTGRLTPDTLSEALVIQKTELQGWRLGELLVHLGQVERSIVESYVTEQLEDALTGLVGREATAWRWKAGRKTRQDIAPPVAIADVIARAVTRSTRWQHVEAALGGIEVVCHLSQAGTHLDGAALAPRAWALLCRVDGQRTVHELADACGFTLYEAAEVVLQLVGLGVVDVPVPTTSTLIVPIVAADEVAQTDLVLPVIASDVADAALISDIPTRAPDAAAPEPAAAASAAKPAGTGRHQARERADQQTRERQDAELVAEQLTELSERGARDRAARRRARGETSSDAGRQPVAPLRPAVDPAQQARLEADLAEAQRLEDERTHRDATPEQAASEVQEERAQSRRRRTAAAAEQAAADRAAAEQAAAEQVAADKAAADKAAAEQVAADKAAAEQVAADKAAAEQVAAERLAAERLAEQAEAERLAHERALAEQAEAERRAAEEAKAEAQRQAAAQAKAQRQAAERAEAERVAAEKTAAAKAAAQQLDAERAAAAKAEAQRVAAAKAAAAKAAAEKAEDERVARETAEAARAEAERVAAETAAAAAQFAAELGEVSTGASTDDLTTVASGFSEFADFNDFAEFAGTVTASVGSGDADAVHELTDISSDMSLGDFAQSLGDDFLVADPAPDAQVAPPAADVRAEEPVDPPAGPEPDVVADAPQYTDTAALLRELSSLGGFGDDATPAPASVPAPRQMPTQHDKKKKRGLFGR